MLTFGPVPSRRLGRSLGKNNIPLKICSYGCCYCQVGKTTKKTIARSPFFPVEVIRESVREKLDQARLADERIDYLTFVPDGEPTLDSELDREIATLRPFGLPIAVISNASLLGREDVRAALEKADWISLKIDSVAEGTWRRINRPHPQLALSAILEGARTLARRFTGRLVTETMLVAGLNDGEKELTYLARYLEELKPSRAYLAVPTRPPAAKWVKPPEDKNILRAYQLWNGCLPAVELLIEYETGEFASLGAPEEALLNILAVHPLTEEALADFLLRAHLGKDRIDRLIQRGELARVAYREKTFFIRPFRKAAV